MQNKLSKKVILLGAALLIVVAVIVVVVVFATKDPVFKIRGSRVEKAMEYYSSIVDYEVGKFETYDEFKKSKWGKSKILGNEVLKDVYYTKDYFKENNLVFVAFNSSLNVQGFEIVDVEEKNGIKNICLVGIGSTSSEEEEATFYCMYETKEALDFEYTLTIEKVLPICFSNVYSTLDHRIGLFFPDEQSPVLYSLNTKEEVQSFVDEDPIITPIYYINRRLEQYVDEYAAENNVWLVRTTVNEFDDYGASVVGNEIFLWKIKDNSYSIIDRSMEDNETVLLCLIVPKDVSITALHYTEYWAYVDPASHIESTSYTLIRDTNSAIIKYNTEKIND